MIATRGTQSTPMQARRRGGVVEQTRVGRARLLVVLALAVAALVAFFVLTGSLMPLSVVLALG
jgi:hypothetical protein